MRRISDVALIHAYKLAIELDLDRDFIKMLEKEIERRDEHSNSAQKNKKSRSHRYY